MVLLHAKAAGSLKSKLAGDGVDLDPRLGSCSQAPGAGAAGSESSQLCPFRRTRCSIPAWIPSCAGHGDTPSLAQVPILSLVEGICDGFAFVWLAASLAPLLAWRGSLCALRGTRGAGAPCTPCCL